MITRGSLVAFALLSIAGCGGAGGEPIPTTSGSSGTAPAPTPTDTTGPTTPPPPTAMSTYFPPPGDTWENLDATALAARFDAAKLGELSTFVEQSSSTTFIVLYDGRIVLEKYWSGSTASTLRDVASVQKSVVSVMVGAAVSRGGLGIDDKVSAILGDGWSNGTPADEAQITVRHLLTMTSGLDENLQRVADPGSTWLYNTNAFHRLELVLQKKTSQSLADLTRSLLFDAIGAGPSAWTVRPFMKDAKGLPTSALEMNARDMARVGLAVMADGKWADKTAVPSAYLATALTSSQALNPSYGFLFWLNGQSSALLPPSKPASGMLMPSAPTDVVAALGAADQKIYVSRSKRLVVTRQGPKAGDTGQAALSSWDDELWKRVMAAAR